MVGIFLVLIACLLWGVDTLIRYPLVMKGFNPVLLVTLEHLLLTLVYSFTWIGALKKIGKISLSNVFSFVVVGGFGSAIATVAFTKSFIYLNPSLVILLQKLQPIFAIGLASVILREKLTPKFLFWSFVCFIGCLLISYPDFLSILSIIESGADLSLTTGAILGYSLVAISVLGWACATVFGKKLSLNNFSTREILGGRFLVGFITLIWFCPYDFEILKSDINDAMRILLMVSISGLLAMYLYYQGMKKLPAKNIAIAEMFFPLSAIVINWIFLDKYLLPIQILGGVILIIGSSIIQLKKY